MEHGWMVWHPKYGTKTVANLFLNWFKTLFIIPEILAAWFGTGNMVSESSVSRIYFIEIECC